MPHCDDSLFELTPILMSVHQNGWTRHITKETDACAIFSKMRQIGNLLGKCVPARAKVSEQIIQPQTIEDAHPRSLSRCYGLGVLPLHTELSHCPRPCRYLLLGCIDPGMPSTATMLMDWKTLPFSSYDLDLLESAPVLVRTGRHSFYSTVLPPNRSFFRYDPGCIIAINDRGKAALQLVKNRICSTNPEIHHWSTGDILVIDNWRILHGREPSEEGSNRRLAKILIDD